jgi:tetratricopeptide (TPR) repeat protein
MQTPSPLRFAAPALLLACLASTGLAGAQPAPAGDPPLSAESQALRAMVSARDLDDAIERGEAYLASHPGDAGVQYWLGNAYCLQAQLANVFTKLSWAGKCRDAMQAAIASEPRLVDARVGLMQYYLQAPAIAGGGRGEASALVDATRAVDPAAAQLLVAITAQIDRDLPAAEAAYRDALATSGEAPRYRQALAGFLASQRRWADARGVLEAWRAASPEDPMAMFQLGRLAALSGEGVEEGLAALDAYLAHPAPPPEILPGSPHWRRALLLEKLGRMDEARAAIREAQRLSPTLPGLEADRARIDG